jgi:excisionase family DNA binding protein
VEQTGEQDSEPELPTTLIDRLAARVVADVWPLVDDRVRPLFETVEGREVDAEPSSQPAPSPSDPGVRPAVWLSAEDVAPVLGMTAHSFRRLARKGECPVVVRRIGGRWCFARSDLERFLESTR